MYISCFICIHQYYLYLFVEREKRLWDESVQTINIKTMFILFLIQTK